MSAKWRKIIWVLLVFQLFLFHGFVLSFLNNLSYYAFRIVNRLSLPYFFYANYKLLFIGGWLLIALLLLIYYLLQYFSFRNACYRKMEPVIDEEQKALFREIYRSTVKEGGNEWLLYCSEEIKSPFVIGYRKPILLLPKGNFQGVAQKLIFQHECEHIRAHDNWYKLFFLVSQCLLWYQPLIYIVKLIGFMDIEVACDESVVRNKEKEERVSYGQTLIDNVRLSGHNRKNVWSSYFYNGKRIMKARINAVMQEEKRWDKFGAAAIGILILETCFFGWQMTEHVREMSRQREMEEQRLVNIYDGYELPDSFTDTALSKMLSLEPNPEDSSAALVDVTGAFEVSETVAEGPWQVKDRLGTLEHLLTRYLYYFEDPLAMSERIGDGYGFKADIIECFQLSWDGTEGVFYILAKEYKVKPETGAAAMQDGWGILSRQGKEEYIYYTLALHIRQADEFVYELVGVSHGETALDAFIQKYPDADYSKAARLYLMENKENQIAYRTSYDCLEITQDGGNTWETVPVELNKLFERGDQMDGQLTQVQDKSAQADEKKIIFAYGGADNLPARVTYLTEAGEWKTSIVSQRYLSVRRFFVSFPENDRTGYLVLTNDRTMWSEASILFSTEDGGSTWKEVGPAGMDGYTQPHSLTTGAVFVTQEVGFVTIYSFDSPIIWRTENGGTDWYPLELHNVPSYYTMAYPPEMAGDGSLRLYLGMDGHSEFGGEKALFLSEDLGETWEYAGIVLRK